MAPNHRTSSEELLGLVDLLSAHLGRPSARFSPRQVELSAVPLETQAETINGPKPYNFLWFCDVDSPEPYKIIWLVLWSSPVASFVSGVGAEPPE